MYLFGIATVEFGIEVVVTTSIAATSFCTILKPCFKREKSQKNNEEILVVYLASVIMSKLL